MPFTDDIFTHKATFFTLN